MGARIAAPYPTGTRKPSLPMPPLSAGSAAVAVATDQQVRKTPVTVVGVPGAPITPDV
jgi:hypothetical protein